VLPAGAGAEVGEEPTAAAKTVVDATVDAGEAGKWGHDGALSNTSREHYRRELPQPSTSLPPCGRGLHHP
jgi:hypothetical protein